MRFKNMTENDKARFLELYNVQGAKKDIVDSIVKEFKIHERTVYHFHTKILKENNNLQNLKFEKIDTNVEYSQDEVQQIVSENNRLRKSLTLQSDKNTAFRREQRLSARKDNIYDTLLESFYNKVKHHKFKSYEPIVVKHKKVTQKEGLCVILSDEHFGELVDSEVTPGNNFNYEIVEKRIMHVIDSLIRYEYQSKELNVFQLLDVLKGIIHGGTFNTEGGLTTSMLKVVEVYVKVYSTLSENYDKINVTVTNSNHDRVVENPSTKDKWDNFGIMLMKMVDMVLKAKGITNVKFSFTKHDYQLVNINGAPILAFHGDSMRGYKPYIDSQVSKLQDICIGIFGTIYKHSFSGHIHKHYSCDNCYGGKSITNSSMVGNSEYGVSSGFTSIRPSQTIIFIEENGDIEKVTTVDLSRII